MNTLTLRLKATAPYLFMGLAMLVMMEPTFAADQKKIGELAIGAAENFKGATFFAKVGAACVGFLMVIYCLYGLSLGRKNDEREYPIGRTVTIGLIGSLMMSIAVVTGIFNTTLLGDEADVESGLEEILEE